MRQTPAGIGWGGDVFSHPGGLVAFDLGHAGSWVPQWPASCNAQNHHKEAAPPNVPTLAG